MPSLRAIFLLATAAFASFTYAAPVDLASLTNPLAGGTGGSSNGLALPLGNTNAPKANGANVNGLGARAPQPIAEKRGAAHESLPTILIALQAKLQDIQQQLNAATRKRNVDPSRCLPILQELRDVLAAVLTGVTALVGLPIEVICALAGKVLSVTEIARLLAAVLTLLCQILALVCKLVGAAGLKAVEPLIQDIAGILVKILTCVFGLLEGLLGALVPLLGTAIQILRALQLGIVLDVLKVARS